MNLRLFLLAFLFLVLPACEMAEAPFRELEAGQVGHPGTGLAFPKRLGGFARLDLHAYDGPNHISVGYNRNHLYAPVIATIYVYPGLSQKQFGTRNKEAMEIARRDFLLQSFAQARQDLEDAHPGAEFLQLDNNAVYPLFGEYRNGLSVVYGYKSKFGLFNVPSFSQLAMFPLGGWLVKFRLTYPVDGAENAAEAIGQWMEEFANANGGQGAPVPNSR